MTDPRLALTFDGPLARLVITRADKLNALDAGMVDAILPLCREVERASGHSAQAATSRPGGGGRRRTSHGTGCAMGTPRSMRWRGCRCR